MNKYLVVLMACMLVLQVEMFALLWLHKQNLKLWEAQSSLNESVEKALRFLAPAV